MQRYKFATLGSIYEDTANFGRSKSSSGKSHYLATRIFKQSYYSFKFSFNSVPDAVTYQPHAIYTYLNIEVGMMSTLAFRLLSYLDYRQSCKLVI